MPNALIFDMDGVLADTEGPICEATIAMFRELYGVDMQPSDFQPYIGTGAVRYTAGPAEAYGLEIDLEAALERRHENFYKIIVASTRDGGSIALPGAHALIDAAYASGDWALAIATSSPQEKSLATARAARLPIEKFAAYINGDMVTHKKPHPEIYLMTADCLGIDPAQCVVVEDAITGVAAAKAAGMACIGVTNSFSAEQLAEADWVVPSLAAITLEKMAALLNGRA